MSTRLQAGVTALALLVPSLAGQEIAPHRSGTVDTPDGVGIHYIESGTGPAILFVPGWTMPAEIWAPQLAHFSRGWRAVAIDPRAQGRSSQPVEGLSVAARARDIKAVVDRLKLAPVVLVGWSLGVSELAAYVDQFGTADVSALVLVDGFAGGEYDPVMTPMMLRMLNGFINDRRAATDGFVRSMYKTPQSDAYLEQIIDASLRTPTNSAVTLFVSAMGSNYTSALAKIDKPTLIAVSRSPFLSKYEEMRGRIRGSRMEIFEGGHALFVDQAARFNALLDEFLAPVRPARD